MTVCVMATNTRSRCSEPSVTLKESADVLLASASAVTFNDGAVIVPITSLMIWNEVMTLCKERRDG